jgi:predicted Zn-dependent peptidase
MVGSDFSESFDPNLFTLYAIAAKGVNEVDIESAIYSEIDKIKKDGITEIELQKIKNQKLIEFYAQIETINGKSNNIGTYELFFGDYRKMFDAPAEYSKVTIEDVKRVASQYFNKSNRTVGILKSNVEE